MKDHSPSTLCQSSQPAPIRQSMPIHLPSVHEHPPNADRRVQYFPPPTLRHLQEQARKNQPSLVFHLVLRAPSTRRFVLKPPSLPQPYSPARIQRLRSG